MNYKLLLFTSLIILTACAGEQEDTESEVNNQDSEQVENISTDNSDGESPAVDTISRFDALVAENMFANEVGDQAWVDYKEISELYTLSDMETFDGAGNTIDEIYSWMTSIVADDVEYESVTLPDGMSETLTYYYKGTVNDEQVDIAKILFHFKFEQLDYTSIAPGAYYITEEAVYDIDDDYANIETFSDLLSFDPTPNIFGISEYRTNETNYHQVLLFSAPKPDYHGNSNLLDSIIFSGEQVFDELLTPFEIAAEKGFEALGYEVFQNSYVHERNLPGEEATEAERSDPNYYLANGYSNTDLENIYNQAYEEFSKNVDLASSIEEYHAQVSEEYHGILDEKLVELEADIGAYVDENISNTDTDGLIQVIDNASSYIIGISRELQAKLDVANSQVEDPDEQLTFNTVMDILNRGQEYLNEIQTKEFEAFLDNFEF